MKEIRITYLQAGQRLDRFLEKYLRETSPGWIYKMLRKKNITLNGKKAAGNEKLTEEDVIRLFFSDETLLSLTGGKKEIPGSGHTDGHQDLSGKTGKFAVLYEDRDILLADKPAGMLSQKASPQDVSLCEYLISYLLSSGQLKEEDLATFRPSVCNRLDRGTSGIVCCGKTMTGLQRLSSAIAGRDMGKYYLCLVKGCIDSAQMLENVLHKDKTSNRTDVKNKEASGGREAKTFLRPLKTGTLRLGEETIQASLLEAELITGRSHQIRSQLAGIGHPILGDPKYSDPGFYRKVRQSLKIRSQLLHCARVIFPEEGFGEELAGREIRSPLPAYFDAVTRQIRPI